VNASACRTKCGGGPGNKFELDARGDIALAGASKSWSACANLCAAPSSPLVTLQPCAEATRWKQVLSPDVVV
jgi:hypothetical protein